MLAAYVTGHGYGHLTRLCEVLRHVRLRAPALPITFAGSVPPELVRRGVTGPVHLRPVATDVGLVQRDALEIDEEETVRRCGAFDAGWEARVEAEVAFLRRSGARLVLADVPALPFEAAARAGLPAVGLGNFSWDWIYRHLARRHPPLLASAERAAGAYRTARLMLELPFAGDLSAFPARERVGFVARRPRVDRAEARRRLDLDGRTAVLVSFGGVGGPALRRETLPVDRDVAWVLPAELDGRLDDLGLAYPDVLGAVDVAVTKPGYGIVTDAIGAGTRLVYTDRGDFPEYPVMVAEMARWLACVHLPSAELREGRILDAVRRVMDMPVPPQPDLEGAARAAGRVLEEMGEMIAGPGYDSRRMPVILAVRDLAFRSKILAASERLGVPVAIAPRGTPLADAARVHGPGTLVVDLGEAGVLEQVAAARAAGATEVVGFLGHLQVELAEAARAAGVDRVLTRGQFVQQLESILRGTPHAPG